MRSLPAPRTTRTASRRAYIALADAAGATASAPPPPRAPLTPELRARARASIGSAAVTVAAVAGANAAAFVAWSAAKGDAASAAYLRRWFTHSLQHPGLAWLLAGVSHRDAGHLLANAGTLLLCSRVLVSRHAPRMPAGACAPRLSPAHFAALYMLGSAASGAAGDAFKRSLGLRGGGLGAGGALSAIYTYFALRHPASREVVPLVAPVAAPARHALIAWVASNSAAVILQIAFRRDSGFGADIRRFDAVAHLTGVAVGAAWFFGARELARRKAAAGADAAFDAWAPWGL